MNANQPWQLLVGQYIHFDRYHLRRFLGAGGFGAVYLADQLTGDRLVRQVALKLMIVGDIDRQLQELQISLGTNHPNLIRYHDAGEVQINQIRFLFLSMEPAECSLERYLEQHNRCLTVAEARGFVRDVAAGLLDLHQPPRIIHRDINPGNILRVGTTWKIGDFGLTRVIGDRSQGDTSNPTMRPGYGAPEAYSGSFTAASDLWSLGIVTVFALTGELPFNFQTLEELHRCVMDCNLNIPRLPSPFQEIVQGCLQRSPRDRWTAQRVLDTLNPSVPPYQPVTPTPPPQSQTPVQRQPTRVSRRLVLMGLVGSGAAIGALGWEQLRLRLTGLPRSGKPIASPTPTSSSATPSTSPSSQPDTPSTPSPSPSPQPDTPSPSVTRNQTFVEDLGGGVALELLYIPAGRFLMGSPDSEAERDSDEGPQHRVAVPAFYMGKYEVTNAQWKAVMNTNPSGRYDAKFQGDRQPVVGVSWEDAQAFCQKLSQQSGRRYRLPTEAEWEYACRAGTTTPFYFGATITPDQVNYDGNYPYGNGKKGIYREGTTEVGSFPANGFDLFDMHGNVWEWCADDWHDSYANKPEELKQNGAIAWTDSNSARKLLRGGSWLADAWLCRSALRFGDLPGDRYVNIGFRVCCSPQ